MALLQCCIKHQLENNTNEMKWQSLPQELSLPQEADALGALALFGTAVVA